MKSADVKKLFIVFGILILVLAAGTVIFLVVIPAEFAHRRYTQAMDVIDRIRQFKVVNGRLPRDIGEIEPKYNAESGPIYYDQKSSDAFIVWFGLGLGESKVYESVSRSWYESD